MNEQYGRRRVVLGMFSAALATLGACGVAGADSKSPKHTGDGGPGVFNPGGPSVATKSAQQGFVDECRSDGGTPGRVSQGVVKCSFKNFSTTCNFKTSPPTCKDVIK